MTLVIRPNPHHQSSTSGTAGNYKIYSGHGRAGSGGTAGTRQYPVLGITGTGTGTGTAGTPGLRTSTGARQQLGEPWQNLGHLRATVPDMPNKLPPQSMSIRYQAADA